MSGYTNREDYAEDGLACPLDPLCQLIADHSDECDPRTEQERWAALNAALDCIHGVLQ